MSAVALARLREPNLPTRVARLARRKLISRPFVRFDTAMLPTAPRYQAWEFQVSPA